MACSDNVLHPQFEQYCKYSDATYEKRKRPGVFVINSRPPAPHLPASRASQAPSRLHSSQPAAAPVCHQVGRVLGTPDVQHVTGCTTTVGFEARWTCVLRNASRSLSVRLLQRRLLVGRVRPALADSVAGIDQPRALGASHRILAHSFTVLIKKEY